MIYYWIVLNSLLFVLSEFMTLSDQLSSYQTQPNPVLTT